MSEQETEAYCSEIEHAMHNLPAVREHISRSYEMPSATNVREKYGIKYNTPFAEIEEADYVITRPFVDAPPESLEAQLTAGSLRGPNMFASFPMVFSKTKQGVKSGGGTEGDGMVVVHLGKNLCGYKGVIHGGLIATLFDEALARSAFYSLPHHVGVTGKLELRYRKPVAADRFYLIETEVVETVGRKCFVAGFCSIQRIVTCLLRPMVCSSSHVGPSTLLGSGALICVSTLTSSRHFKSSHI